MAQQLIIFTMCAENAVERFPSSGGFMVLHSAGTILPKIPNNLLFRSDFCAQFSSFFLLLVFLPFWFVFCVLSASFVCIQL